MTSPLSTNLTHKTGIENNYKNWYTDVIKAVVKKRLRLFKNREVRGVLREIIRENKGFFNQIIKLSRSELIKIYKGAALGPVWALIKPAMTIFVYWFAFQIGLKSAKNVTSNGIEVDFFIFLMVGMVPWFFMRDAILDGMSCFRTNKAFITKMRFPVSAIPTYKLLADLYVNICLIIVMYIILLCFGITPSIYNIQIFYYVPLMYMCFLFLSWITAPLAAISKDFQNLVRTIITAIFWLSGIIWNPYELGDKVLQSIVLATPVTYFANGFRNTFIFERWFFETGYETLACLGWVVVFAIMGTFTYNRLRKIIPDLL